MDPSQLTTKALTPILLRSFGKGKLFMIAPREIAMLSIQIEEEHA